MASGTITREKKITYTDYSCNPSTEYVGWYFADVNIGDDVINYQVLSAEHNRPVILQQVVDYPNFLRVFSNENGALVRIRVFYYK